MPKKINDRQINQINDH